MYMGSSRHKISGNSMAEDMITYVAVGKDVQDCKSILSWALENNGGSRICIIHVHKPAKLFPLVRSIMMERKVRERLETSTQNMHAIIEEYIQFCKQKGVHAQTLTIEMDSIRKGILKLIDRHGIRKLVIGSTSANHYRRKVELGSKKAKHVCKTAPVSCQVQVICKGHLIFTRQASAADTETRQLNLNRSRSGPLLNNNSVGSPVIECSDISKSRSVTVGRNRSTALAALIAPFPKRSKELSSPTSPGGSSYSASSPTREVEITLNSWNNGNGKALQYSRSLSPLAALDYSRSSSTLELAPSVLQQSPRLISSSSNISTSSNGAHNVTDRSFEEQLQQAKAAFKKEALVRQRAEEYTIDAIRRALDAENQRDICIEELRISREQETSLKSQIAELQKERDELQMERDHALKEAEGLKRKLGEGSNGHMLELPEFSLSKIAEATQGFHESQKIGEGGYGNIYIGRLHTEVAIKMLRPHGSQGSQEFQMEVGVLGQLRHPNLVKLIGSCPESFALIYEYLPNGSLEDRLKCKDKSPPLSWQTRLRIATELCSVLVYLHSSTRPHTIVHGDLKPANILLDSNFVCKLSDFGICRVLSRDQSSSDSVTLSHNTIPKGTLPYLDPEFLRRGVLTVKSDVYSFGIILLQLLTGKSPPYSIVDEVKSALRAGNFESLLDPSAGRWPFEVAESLAELALMCSDNNRKGRPDLGTGVLERLESLRDPTGDT